MNTFFKQLSKHTRHVAKHVHLHHKKYLGGFFASFALVKTFVLLAGFLGIAQLGSSFASYSPNRCSDNSGSIDIPLVECEALTTLYGSTNGDLWNNKTNRFESTTICGNWYGISCSNDSVYQITLQDNNLSGTADLSGLTSLQSLYLSDNQLSAIDVSALTSLQTLSLSSNQLSTIDVSNLPSLTSLMLNNNLFTTIDISALTNLTDLDLSDNQLSAIDVSALTNLIHLRLSYNQLSSIDVSALTGLTQLFLSYNQLSTLPESFIGLTNLNWGMMMAPLTLDSNCRDIGSMSSDLLTFLDTKVGDSSWQTSINPSCPAPEAPAGFSCDNVTDVPVSECNTLVGLYNSTNGDNWNTKTNWNGSDDNTLETVCDWYGITCSNDSVSQITLQNNNLSGTADLSALTSLQSLNLSFNPFSIIDVSALTSLQSLNLSFNQLSAIDVSALTNLQTLNLGSNQLSTIDVSALTSLQYLYLWYNQLSTIDVSGLTSLTQLTLYYNQLSAIDVSALTSLQSLELGGNLFTTIDLPALPNLTNLSLGHNQLSSIDVSALTSLQSLYLNNNFFTTIDLPALPNLTNLDLSYNQLSSIDVSALTSLTQLTLYDNQLSSIDVSALTNLIHLRLSYNQLSSIDVSALTSLTQLTLYDNQLSTIDVSGLTSLTQLELYNNQLSTIDVSALTNLQTLYLNNNQLSAIDLSALTSLQYLDLSNNQLSSIDVSALTSLQYLSLDNNQLSAIDLSALTSLSYLYLNNNQLSAIDLSALTSLQSLDLSNNQLSGDLSMFCNLTQLYNINIDHNRFDGMLPECFFDFNFDPNWGSSRIDYNMLDIGGLTEEQIAYLDQTFYSQNDGPTVDRRTQYISSNLSITQSVMQNSETAFTVDLSYRNIGPQDMSGIMVYYNVVDGIDIDNSSPDYSSQFIDKIYGEAGDSCYDSMYANNTGAYRDALEDWVYNMTQGERTFIDFLEQEAGYGSGMTDRGISYIGDGSDIGKFWIDYAENINEGVLDGTFIGLMNMIGIDITHIEGCGTGGIPVYAFDIGNLVAGATGSVSLSLTSDVSYTLEMFPSTARIASTYAMWGDVNPFNNISILGVPVPGCIDTGANNYNPDATETDGSCTYTILGCMLPNDQNYNPEANQDDGSCISYVISGCTNPDASNYDSDANQDDGSCIAYVISGCTNPDASNYDSDANQDDGSCINPYLAWCTENSEMIDISVPECEGLANFYFSTNGYNWTSSTGWFDSTTVCQYGGSWYGISCTNGSVSQIHLGSNNLSGTADLSGLTSLTQLSLSYNQLFAIDVSALTSLIQLELYNNQLSTIDVSALTSLQTLYLNSNQLSTIDVSALTSLIQLELYNNQLSTIDVSALTSLQTLYLNSNQLSTIDVSGLTSLQHLDLSNNQLSTIDLSALTSLKYLYLNNNLFSGDLSMFCNLTQLDGININNNRFEGEIPSCFFEFTNLGKKNDSRIDYNMLDISGLTEEQIAYLDQYFYFGDADEGELVINRRNQYTSSDLSLIQSIEQGSGTNFVVDISYINAGPKNASGVEVYYDVVEGIAINNSSPDYSLKTVDKVYGEAGDSCYDSMYANNTGAYRDALEDWVYNMTQGERTFIDFLEQQVGYGPGMSKRGISYIGDGSDAGKFFVDFIPNEIEGGFDGTFIGLMNMIGIDITNIEGCGTRGILVYSFDIGNLVAGATGSISLSFISGLPYTIETFPGTAEITSTNPFWFDDNTGDNITTAGSEIDIENNIIHDTSDQTLTGFGYVDGFTSTGDILFTGNHTIHISNYEETDNHLDFITSGFSIEVIDGTRDGLLYAPTETTDPNEDDLPHTTDTRTVLLTVEAGASGASLEASGGYFTIDFVVPDGIEGETLPIYRSEDEITWVVNTPDPTCELDADLVCSFRTDSLSYFTAVRESAGGSNNNNNSNVGGGGGGGMTTDAKAGICEARDCSDSYYDGVCGTCEASKHKAAGTGKTLLIDSATLFNAEVNKVKYSMKGTFTNELIQAYVFAKDIGITTIEDIDKAMLYDPLIRQHAAKMMVNYAVNILGMQADGTRTSCEYSDMANASVEMKLYARLACQLGIMGVESDAAKTPAKKFNGTAQVARDQFGTMLSRTMYANDPVEVTSCRYCAHLNRLKTDGIMTKITTPSSKEVRGYVWLMMMRAYQNVINK